MNRRTFSHAQLWLVIASVGGTSLFAPAAMARMAEEYFLAEAQRQNADTSAEESDESRELLAEQQYLNWDRSVSKISKPLSVKQLTAFSWRTSIRSDGQIECGLPRNPSFDMPAARRAALNTMWPHAPPLPV